MEQSQSYGEVSYNTTSSRRNYSDSTALKLRLETKELIENIELFLKGEKILFLPDESGKIELKSLVKGKPKANDKGIQAILNFISCIVNPSVVQGNFKSDRKSGYCPGYEQYIHETEIDLSCILMVNLINWDISEDDYDLIIDFIMKLIIPFMTRLIDNEERKGYSENLKAQSTEVIRNEPERKKRWGII